MLKILIIEDETTLRANVMEWLTFEGYEAIGAADGIAGVEAAFRHQPDLIVCDINMPRLDGYGVLSEVLASPITAFTPFIFLTAKSTYEDIREGMKLGADDYLTKPFKRLDLLQAIATKLQKKTKQEDEHEQQVALLQELLDDEREQRLLKAKLVAMFSHDFRNPLLAIILSTHTLRHSIEKAVDATTEAGLTSHVDLIEASAQQLLQMLDDMLLISQMEAGKLSLKPEALDLGSFFQQIVADFQSIYRKTHLIIYERQQTVSAYADRRLLRHMAINVISNAVKYSPQGGEVRVGLTWDESHWIFSVQDWGIGIPEADLKQLCEPFYRATNAGQFDGTGLGLAMVKQTADLHGGAVHLTSTVGDGTTVTVKIPHTAPQ